MTTRRAAIAGLAAATLGAGAAELIALPADSGPIATIGSAIIDLTPGPMKEAIIQAVGTADKPLLIALVILGIAALAAGAGLLEARTRGAGRVAAILFGGIAAIVAATRPGAGVLVAGAALAGGVVAAIMLARLVPQAVAAAHADTTIQPDRRTFLRWAAGSAIVGVAVAAGANIARTATHAGQAIRRALTLPRAAVAAPPVPAAAELGIEGLAPVITPNSDFYRIDTALVVPQVDPADWSLRIHGMVENEVTLTWDELLALPLEEHVATLLCVSNPVGGTLVGNALWLGYPVRELLARAAPLPGADMVLSTSADGFTASTPLDALTDDRSSLLAVGMNGEPLPVEHGFPVRLVVPGLYGYVSATKWVVELKVTRFDQDAAYWTRNGWSERGPVKLSSRIDVPRARAQLSPGAQVIAGVAWQTHTGISGVEVQIDEGPWQAASLASAISDDTWVQWSLPWDAATGQHRIRCRAINAAGEVQDDAVRDVVPDGATGLHELIVSVG